MDIYEWAKSNNADYQDGNGNTYLVQKYLRERMFFGDEAKIEVVDYTGTLIGYAKREG